MVGGVVLIRLIAPFMDRYFTGQGSFWLWLVLGILAIILLGTMLVTVLTVKERPGSGSPRLPLLPTLYKSFKIDVKTHPDFILFLAASFFIFMAWATVQGHALYLLMDVVGATGPAAATGDLLIAVGIGMLAVVYPAGRLSDRVGRKPVAVSSGLLGALGIVALFFSPSHKGIRRL